MPLNVDQLLDLCNFYKKASLETDMAKRIMLSVIPSAMTESEAYHSGGFDYKSLKSAVNGAKDLVKYGTLACVEEMSFYGSNYESYKQQKEKDQAKKDSKLVKNLANSGKYKECLYYCTKMFNTEGPWEFKFGGPPWAKISDTLFKIAEKNDLLQLIREESRSKPNPKTDYLSLEVETMKEIVVLMNVFDGLAHNNGNVMPKLVHEEYREKISPLNEEYREKISPLNEQYSQNNAYGEDTDEDVIRQDSEEKISKRVKNLMDAKEINDPLTVYKAIQKIIESPENKHLFGNWSEKIRNMPAFQAAKTMKDMKKELQAIKNKKLVKSKLMEIEHYMDSISSIKDKYINTKIDTDRFKLMLSLDHSSTLLSYEISNLTDLISSFGYNDSQSYTKMIGLNDAIIATKMKAHANTITVRARDVEYDGINNAMYGKDYNALITDVSNLKNSYRQVIGLIDQYIG